MIFGEFKGLHPHGRFRASAAVLLGAIQLLCLFGYLGGFFDRNTDGRLEWHVFQWDTETVVYTVVMWCSWIVAISMLLLSKEDVSFKVGGSIIFSLPVTVFVILFFELVELGPRNSLI